MAMYIYIYVYILVGIYVKISGEFSTFKNTPFPRSRLLPRPGQRVHPEALDVPLLGVQRKDGSWELWSSTIHMAVINM